MWTTVTHTLNNMKQLPSGRGMEIGVGMKVTTDE
jgi:hypothetical protein